MEISAFTLTGNSTGVASSGISNQLNSPALDAESTPSPVAEDNIDSANTSNQNLLIARQIMTQQLQIALQLSTSNSPYQSSSSDAAQSQATNSQYLTQQALQKFGHTHYHNHESQEQSAPITRTILMQVDQSFSSSATILTNMGLMQGQVADEVSQTRDEVVQAVQGQTEQQSPVNSGSNLSDGSDTADKIDSMSVDSITAQRALTTSLQLTTREGDVVTINLSRSQSMTADRFSSDGNKILQVSSDREMQFEITLQGDLNAKESRSIRKALEQVTEIARKLFSGKVEAAMEKLSEFHINTQQLASMALNMTSSRSIEASSVYSEISGPGNEPSPQQTAQDAPVQTSAANNAIDNRSPQTTAVTTNGPEDTASTAALSNEESPAAVISTVAQQSASTIAEIADNSNLENPFQQIRQMFNAISSMFQTDTGSHHRQSILQLFEGITDLVEQRHRHEHHELHRHHGHDN